MIEIILGFILYVSLASGFPSGAPPDVCSYNLSPVHGGHVAHQGSSPYTLTASASTFTKNKPITVVLKGPAGKSFKGFAIQARDSSDNFIASGEWSGSGMKQLPCGAATHTSDTKKNKVELTWTPKGSGEVTFVATVVESFDSFYTAISSTVSASASSSVSNTVSSTTAASTTAANSYVNHNNIKLRPAAGTSNFRPNGGSRPNVHINSNWELDYDQRPFDIDNSNNRDQIFASPDQQFSSFFSPQFAQPEVGSSATNQEDQIGPAYYQPHRQQQQQHQSSFYNNPYQGHRNNFQRHPQIHAVDRHQQHFHQNDFGNFPAQSEFSHRFVHRPQGGYQYSPHQQQQQFGGPWNQYHHRY